jgi:hypothetical protein
MPVMTAWPHNGFELSGQVKDYTIFIAARPWSDAANCYAAQYSLAD